MGKELINKKIIIVGVLTLILVVGLAGFLLRGEKTVKAQAEPGMVCNKVIPIGEAASTTLDLYSELFAEVKNIREEIKTQTQNADEVLRVLGKKAKNCDLSKCKAVCENISPPLNLTIDFSPFPFSWTFKGCYPACGMSHPCMCETGTPCGDDLPGIIDIAISSTEKIDQYTQNIKDKIGAIRKKEKPVTEDIEAEGWLGLAECTVEEYEGWSALIHPECARGITKISVTDWIERKLMRARNEFQRCSTPRSDWPKFGAEGLFVPKKAPMKCHDVIEGGYKIKWAETECKDKCATTSSETECIECLCHHPYNWFCCEGE